MLTLCVVDIFWSLILYWISLIYNNSHFSELGPSFWQNQQWLVLKSQNESFLTFLASPFSQSCCPTSSQHHTGVLNRLSVILGVFWVLDHFHSAFVTSSDNIWKLCWVGQKEQPSSATFSKTHLQISPGTHLISWSPGEQCSSFLWEELFHRKVPKN